MRNKSFLQILFLTALIFSCKKDSLISDLKGKWVRIDNEAQILTFGYLDNEDWFTLLKGYRIDNDGNQRPIELLGEYAIKNAGDSISIHWMHSSSSFWPTYYFALKDSKIEIGDLTNGSDSIFVYRKTK